MGAPMTRPNVPAPPLVMTNHLAAGCYGPDTYSLASPWPIGRRGQIRHAVAHLSRVRIGHTVLHPKSTALPTVDRPRIAHLGQQIGSNLLSRASRVVRCEPRSCGPDVAQG